MFQVTRHVPFLVEVAGVGFPAIWTEVRIDGEAHTHLAILRAERLLFPRDGIGLGLEAEVRGLPLESVRAWLEQHGYRVVSGLESHPG